ncbi:hypothetical protein PHO31112_03232 [Pandoraea horticolens]|uniref:Uncharacterized protein n=1 Tax=Pandoraea horticolens TaxID=2508298 RepID=A0A5E4WDU5_9BURK|nr:hypothetical protein PHO31112_03232 [Pandoraea horticolens]
MKYAPYREWELSPLYKLTEPLRNAAVIAEIRRAEATGEHDTRLPVTVDEGPNAMVVLSGPTRTVKRC